MDSERSRPARRRAETALVYLLTELDEEEVPLVILGGLVPDVLAIRTPGVPAHVGTTDVDILVDLRGEHARALCRVEEALGRIGFSPSGESLGWRWMGIVDERPVRMEFLCELDDVRADAIVRAEGCERLSAANLRGVGFVMDDWREIELSAVTPGGTRVAVTARFAELEGYLLAKAFSMTERSVEKDYYDFVYVLVYNRRGGPSGAAGALNRGKFAPRLSSLRRVFREIAARFEAPDALGPRSYALQARLGDPGADEARLRNDAVSAVKEFIEALEVPWA